MGEKITNRIEGVLDKHKGGFGFVKQEDGDIFISRDNMNGAMNGDYVTVDLLPEYLWEKRPEGIIDNVLERNYKEIIGTFDAERNFGFVVDDNGRNPDDIFIRKKDFNGARNGDKVVAVITKYPDKKSKAEGKITEIVAGKKEKGSELKVLIRSKGYYETFPFKVEAEAKRVSKEDYKKALKGRTDFRNDRVFTIDGEDAKDLDDAVSIKVLPNGNYLLGVHIADVSHYVIDGRALDTEALKRGNSVYMINHVVPMLPVALSNGVCSLNPNVDRLTLSCVMEFTKEGKLEDYSITEGVIKSVARLNYTEVSDMLEKEDDGTFASYGEIYEDIKTMGELAKILFNKRVEKGSLDFGDDESEIILGKNEVPVYIGPAERRTGNKLIEEFMLAANKTIAEHFFWMNIPFVYRVHEKPEIDSINELKAFLLGFGLSIPGNPDNIHPGTLNNILEKVKGEAYEGVINTMMIRSMKKAFYSPTCSGHFGLSFKYYCHFTSPIRRYPDLIVHRIIKDAIKGQLTEEKIDYYRGKVEEAALSSSNTERKAVEAERDAEKLKKAQYMERQKGKEFDGVISGVTSFGIYVELPNTIEGMVRLDSIRDDFYEVEQSRYSIKGNKTGKTYKLGQKVRVKCIDASRELGQIDFILI